ncbi:Chemotaxis protein methyltransferase [Edwardsiella tarda]|nr:Chemotaxis protein methyltransferase [Edwardsiella tarda]
MTNQVQQAAQGENNVSSLAMQRLTLGDAHFRRISQLIYQRAGIVLADHKREMVYNRLVRRLRALNLNDFGDYLAQLESHPESAEWQTFVNALTTNLTAFFARRITSRSWRSMRAPGGTTIAYGARRPRRVRNLTPSP